MTVLATWVLLVWWCTPGLPFPEPISSYGALAGCLHGDNAMLRNEDEWIGWTASACHLREEKEYCPSEQCSRNHSSESQEIWNLSPILLLHESESVNCSVMSNSLWPHGVWPTRFLCPWNSPDKNTGVGCHLPLPGDNPNPGIEPESPALQVNSLPSKPPRKHLSDSHTYLLEARQHFSVRSGVYLLQNPHSWIPHP